MLYLMLIPGLFFLFIYKLAPLYGILIAFKDYNIFLGSNPIDAIGLSDWVGLEHFRRLFASSQFTKVLANTLIINGLKILWLFPIPIICAILLNEIRRATYRKFAQTAIYMPYFFSWVVIFGIFYSLFGSYGIINTAITAMGGTRIGFFTDNSVFRSVLVFTEGWKEVGYNTVIYLAAITGIDITLYEAARVDGANAWQRFTRITLPLAKGSIVVAVLFRMLDALRMYDLPYIMVGPNPDSPTATVSQLVVAAIRQDQVNVASALSTLIFLLIFLIALFFVKVLGARLNKQPDPVVAEED